METRYGTLNFGVPQLPTTEVVPGGMRSFVPSGARQASAVPVVDDFAACFAHGAVSDSDPSTGETLPQLDCSPSQPQPRHGLSNQVPMFPRGRIPVVRPSRRQRVTESDRGVPDAVARGRDWRSAAVRLVTADLDAESVDQIAPPTDSREDGSVDDEPGLAADRGGADVEVTVTCPWPEAEEQRWWEQIERLVVHLRME